MSENTKKKYYGDNTKGTPAETIVEYTANDDDRIFELEKQLHEQYAINNNSNSAALISLMGALLVVMTGYGYVLYQYYLCPCRGVTMVYVTACVSSLVMTLLHCVCIHLGAGQRMEQFITFAIRINHYQAESNFDILRYKAIFPNGYHPFMKTKGDFVQGIYNLLSIPFMVVVCMIPIVACIITSSCECLLLHCVTIISLFITCRYRNKKYVRYQEREKEFMELFELIKEDSNNKENKTSYKLTTTGWGIFIVSLFFVLFFGTIIVYLFNK